MLASNDLADIFLYETEEHLRTLEAVLTEADRAGSFTPEQVDELFRVMHTIKGSAAMMRLDELSGSAHLLEDMFSAIRASIRKPRESSAAAESAAAESMAKSVAAESAAAESVAKSAATKSVAAESAVDSAAAESAAELSAQLQAAAVPVMYSALGYFRKSAVCVRDGGKTGFLPDEIASRVREVTARFKPCTAPDGNAPRAGIAQTQTAAPEQAERIHIVMKPTKLVCTRVLVVLNSIRKYCVSLATEPPELELRPELADAITSNGFTLTLVPVGGNIAKILRLLERNVYVAASKLEVRRHDISESTDRIIGVRQSKLGEHIDLLGELLTKEVILEDILKANGMLPYEVSHQLHELRRSISALHSSAISMSLIEADTLLFRLRMLAREMAEKQGKLVNFVTVGEKTAVDKTVLDKLSDPLMHIVRNALDHGIGTPEERLREGKPEAGTVRIEVSDEHDTIRISVTDDGSGINSGKVLAKAEAQGLISSGSSGVMTEADIFRLLLLPGFSTSDNVSEYSGRGVGLDVVNTELTRLGGSLAIESRLGEGSRFTLTIPSTLTIIEALDVTIGGYRMLLPLRSAVKIVDSGSAEAGIRTVSAELFSNSSSADSPPDMDSQRRIIVRTDSGPAALPVGTVGNIGTVSVKPLPALMNGMKRVRALFSGCAVLGDGRVCLILDTSSI